MACTIYKINKLPKKNNKKNNKKQYSIWEKKVYISKEHCCQYSGTPVEKQLFAHLFVKLPWHKDTASYCRNTQCDHNLAIIAPVQQVSCRKIMGWVYKSCVKKLFRNGGSWKLAEMVFRYLAIDANDSFFRQCVDRCLLYDLLILYMVYAMSSL